MSYVICKSCGWIHVAASEKEIKEHLQGFQDYIDNLDEATKNQESYKYFSVEQQLKKQKHCFRCDSQQLRLTEPNERPPMLSNVQAIIFE